MCLKILNILLFLSLYSFGQVSGQSTDKYFQKNDKKNNQLKVLSWNIYMLPANSFRFSSPIKRSKKIVEVLLQKDYDIVCFQELCHKRAEKIISEGLREKFPFQLSTSDKTGFIHVNSGLWIFSKYPIIKINELVFNDCLDFDCMMRKGALLVELSFFGNKIQLINTHLQSGRKGDRDKIRLLQTEQIYSDFKLSSNNLIQLLCGDFNTSSELQKNQMLSILKAIDGKLYGEKQYSWPSFDYYNGYSTLLDYIFLRNKIDSVEIERKILEINSSWKKKCKSKSSLSDHLSVEAIIKFN